MALRLYETFLPVGGDRLRRLSGVARPAGGAPRPHPDPDPRAECRARPGQPPGRGDADAIATAYPRSSGFQRRIADEGRVHRQSGPRRSRCFATSPSRRSADMAVRCSSPAAARARRSCPRSCPRARPASRAFPPPPPGHPAMPRRGYRGGPRPLCRARHSRRSRHLYHRHAGPLAWSHLVIGRAGASTIAELTAAGRPAILIPCRRRPTITRPPMPATWPGRAAPG